jgi:hypothetical protein
MGNGVIRFTKLRAWQVCNTQKRVGYEHEPGTEHPEE